jgi:hypothetical protein
MKNVGSPLYMGTQRAYHEVMGFAWCAARFSERKPPMKTLLRALNRASKKHDHIHRTDSGGPPPTEVRTRQEQHRNGGAVWGCDGAPVAQVHVLNRPTRYGPAHALLRDGAPGTGRTNDRARAFEDARSRSDDRLGRDAVGRAATDAARAAVNRRLEQSLLIILTEHPLFTAAGRHAGALWMLGVPMSAGAFRDQRYHRLIKGTADFEGDDKRCAAFNLASEQELARSIAHLSRVEVQHDAR